jgi:hypothetical protein
LYLKCRPIIDDVSEFWHVAYSAVSAKLQLLQTVALKTKMADDKNLAAVTIRCVMLKT